MSTADRPLLARYGLGVHGGGVGSRVVVLGGCAGWPEAGRACSGYLLEHEGTRVVLARLEGGGAAAVTTVFEAHPLPAGAYRLGPLRLQSWALPHHVPDAGVRLCAPGLAVAYTGDTGPDPALADLGRDADLYVVEATDRHQRPGVPPAPT